MVLVGTFTVGSK
jgi:hypothetical protein